ncbi:MAG: OsmC family protein [Candidatus Omnitrophota bacterium]
MVKMNVVYEGNLRCRLTHEQSASVIVTDAPKDNMGKGEAFSPTDLVASALASCLVTVMAIAAGKYNIDLQGLKVDIRKDMIISPVRRIGTINVDVHMPKGIPKDKRPLLENIAFNCPVHKSLHPDVEALIRFDYSD